MKLRIFLLLCLALALPALAEAVFERNLKLGDKGMDVLELQKLLNRSADTKIAVYGPGAPGEETDYFGNLTLLAVKKFQTKHKTEVLYPASLSSATGFVGPLTRAKISAISADLAKKVVGGLEATGVVDTKPKPTAQVIPSVILVSVDSVLPNKVKAGEKVTVSGSGFAKTGNKVSIYYGNLVRTFSGLSSEDGKTIEFVYEPPHLETMTESQFRALPADVVSQLENPVRAAGSTLSEVLSPYKNFKSEEELTASLVAQGKSLDVLYDLFYITVENDQGSGYSKTALLWGMRELPFNKSVADKATSLFARVKEIIGPLAPRANAQIPGGGFHTGVIMYCTCGQGHLSFAVSLTGAGTGFLWFPPGMVLAAGTGFVASPWIGYIVPFAGTCAIYAGMACITIPANMPVGPMWGSTL